MKAGFITCVELGLSCMRAIYDVGGRLDFAITLPDDRAHKKSGRVYIDDFCAQRDIQLFKFRNINTPECVELLRRVHPDILFIIGWSQIAGPDVLAAADRVIGIHPTLLPVGRGRAAIPWAIIKGLPETGITMFQLDHGVDTGGILAQLRLPVGGTETATTLYARIAAAHEELMRSTWPKLASGELPSIPQDERDASYWAARIPADGELRPDFSIEQVDRLVRATTHPYPGAFISRGGHEIVRIWSGRPAQGSAPPGAHRLRFADGEYDALDWVVEPR